MTESRRSLFFEIYVILYFKIVSRQDILYIL